ncbi:MAG: hypothetical protein HY541_03975, partial [Deltaproteobacteria bacterium]|nr:hypothetical protein [Deltaproteobacteria bacterium]
MAFPINSTSPSVLSSHWAPDPDDGIADAPSGEEEEAPKAADPRPLSKKEAT